MKFNFMGRVPRPEVLRGGLLASLFGLLPTIVTGAVYLIVNLTHGIDFATGGRMGENRISAMISILNINTLWLPITGFLLLVPAVKKHKAAAAAIATLQILCAAINFNRGLYTEMFLELTVAAAALLGSSNHHSLSNDLGETDE